MRNENKLLFDIADSYRLIAQFLDGNDRFLLNRRGYAVTLRDVSRL